MLAKRTLVNRAIGWKFLCRFISVFKFASGRRREKKKNQRGLFTQRGSLSRHSSLLQANKAKTAVEFQGWIYKIIICLIHQERYSYFKMHICFQKIEKISWKRQCINDSILLKTLKQDFLLVIHITGLGYSYDLVLFSQCRVSLNNV